MFTLAFMTVALGSIATLVAADTHHITVNNKCGYGTPTMYGPAANAPFKSGAINISGGYSSSIDLPGLIIYLQHNGRCDINGGGCLIVEGSLLSGSKGQQSAIDISRISPHTFDQAVSFSLSNGQGNNCGTASCACNVKAFCAPGDTACQRSDYAANAGLTVTFCP